MTPELLKVLAEIAAHGRVEAETPEQRAVTDKLFDLGVLNIAITEPPSWSYTCNAAGKATLAKALAALTAEQQAA